MQIKCKKRPSGLWLRMMCVIVFGLVSVITASAQQRLVTLHVRQQPMTVVFEDIEKQTKMYFLYNTDVVNVTDRITVNADKEDLSTVLDDMFRNRDISYIINDNQIVLNRRTVKSASSSAKSGKRTLSGTVKDIKDGEPLIGAVVRVQGDDKSAALVDADGNFTISVDELSGKKPVLEISYIGYNKREVPVGDLNHVDVNMTGAANTLDEVIVVGSGTQKKVSVTGSISTVSGTDLKMPTTTLSRALGGRIAGVITRQTSGEPGTGAEFYIRGISTFGGKATPLILLDDVEITATDLDYIPAENIESFTVLKDASATAIYGARGANGVMIITTKGGEYNTKTKINLNIENAFNFQSKTPELIGGVDFMNFYNRVNEGRNPGAGPLYSQEKIERTAAGVNPYLYPDVNWKDELFRDVSMRQRANLNVSGGGAKAKYYMSLEAQHEDGLLKTDKLYSWNNNIQIYNYTFQNNISYKLTPTTTVVLNLNAQIRQTSSPNTSVEEVFKRLGSASNPVDFPVYFPAGPNGEVRYGTKRYNDDTGLYNPKMELNRTFKQVNYSMANAVIKLDQDLKCITKGLKLNLWVNWRSQSSGTFTRSIDPYRYYIDQVDGMDPEAPVEPQLLNPNSKQFITESGLTRVYVSTFELQGNVNWARKFGSHDLTAMLMYRMREHRDSSPLPNRNQGLSGRVTYDYDHRYLAEFNFGYNGTERLAREHRFCFFPAMSLGWVISNERFWEPLGNTVTHLKLRGSYGLVGSDNLASPNGTYFLYRDQIYSNNLNFWGFTAGNGDSYFIGYGPLVRYYALPDIVWEKSKKLDVGIDMTLWGKLNLTAEYFREDRYDIFMERGSWPWSLGYGLAVPWANVGKALNHGFELSANWNYSFDKDLSVSFQGNLTYNQNKFVDKDEPTYKYPWKYMVNRPLDNCRRDGYIAEGLFQSEEEIATSAYQGGNVKVGDIKYRDLNGDGQINGDDQTMISKYGTVPRLMYGFGATVNWRKWDFGFFFTGAGCRTLSIRNAMDPGVSATQQNLNVFKWVYDNAFDPAKGNFDAQYPLPGITTADNSNNNGTASSYWLRDGSYLRLRSLELGWSFKYGRIYASGSNLLCFSKFKIWDPELNTPYKYPLPRTVNVGVQFHL